MQAICALARNASIDAIGKKGIYKTLKHHIVRAVIRFRALFLKA